MKTLFDPVEAAREKSAGMNSAATNRAEVLRLAKAVAEALAEANPTRTCTADDVQEVLTKRYGIAPDALGNAAGSIFRGNIWQSVGFMQSTRTTNHARLIRVWKLVTR